MMDNRTPSCQSSYRMPQNQNAGAMSRPSAAVVSVPKPCRKDLMNKINQYSFAMNEANLYLDTHPFDMEALVYFQKYRELRVDAVKEYAKYYAPLCIDYAVSDKTPWSWVNEPWPWEGVEC